MEAKNGRYNKRYEPKTRVVQAIKRIANSAAGEGAKNKGIQAVLDEVQNLGKKYVPKGTFSNAGKDLGGFFGPIGSELGGWAGGELANIFGFGDYKIGRGRKAAGGLRSKGVPAFKSSGSDHIVTHREYIADVTTGAAALVNAATPYQYQTYNVNPGLPGTFPYLNSIAVNFEEYEILGMVFEFVSNSATALNSTNTALGTVIMSGNYNLFNGAYASKLAQENSEFCKSAKPSQDIVFPIECKRGENVLKNLFVRSGTLPTGYTLNMTDLCQLQIATQGMQAINTVIGELWCSYKIRFKKTVLNAGLYNIQTANYYTTTGIANATPLGTSGWVARANNYLPLAFATSGLSFTMPSYIAQGNYLLVVQWTGSAVTWAPPTFTITNGSLDTFSSLSTANTNYGTETNAPFNGALVSTSCVAMYVVTVNAIGSLLCTITLSAGGTVPTTAVQVIMTPYNAAMLT